MQSPELYNGYSLEFIQNHFHADMPQIHRDLYIDNCKKVIECQTTGFNLDYAESLKFSNFLLIEFYLTGKHLKG